ncbi:uncharacterized protein LOC132697349 [Cylas formicarius]|uniref:uncharacterized protein LOC132697349 n=1 Tax=Cylas formicarius TaxID=197179 RepID=UPI002958D5D2|nr:uncharacterized protein LOC132697349 [Cylas formicarius]
MNVFQVALLIVTVLAVSSLVRSLPVHQANNVNPSIAESISGYSLYEPEGYGTYAFGYDIDYSDGDNTQFRDEERQLDGSVVGRYGFLTPEGRRFLVEYTADKDGYRAKVREIQAAERMVLN